ncbi:uncharacterized protein LOC109858922 isoform X3 [Pseudomyrmex gracilis]|uniref:uncharacterized protein LOC109858922 isoform X3 n=1 Tax=Pseudomyrmex gracilis TaxID=219809 RepID=UPI0009953220|nr:uncharacterized protein LOC109858922 isoform X3 [Pseudomyrmex gracilis]
MEELRTPQRIVDISEPILVEDSTYFKSSLSLIAVIEQLNKNATHHDYFVALLLVLLAESGFQIFSSDNPTWERNSSNKLESYMNLKEISRRFKDYVATPLRTDVLLDLGLTNPSYMGLPLELKMKIQDMTK